MKIHNKDFQKFITEVSIEKCGFDVLAKSRKIEVIFCRQSLQYCMKSAFGISLEQIAEITNKTHATIINSIRKSKNERYSPTEHRHKSSDPIFDYQQRRNYYVSFWFNRIAEYKHKLGLKKMNGKTIDFMLHIDNTCKLNSVQQTEWEKIKAHVHKEIKNL